MAGLRMIGAMLMICIVVASPLVEAALTCGQVASVLAPCLSYLRNGRTVRPACCSGVKSLSNAASTPQDRQTACQCLKAAASLGINLGVAIGLPAKCGVNITNKISPNTDCSKVH